MAKIMVEGGPILGVRQANQYGNRPIEGFHVYANIETYAAAEGLINAREAGAGESKDLVSLDKRTKEALKAAAQNGQG